MTYKSELKELKSKLEILKDDKARFTKKGDNVGRIRSGIRIEETKYRIRVITGKTVEV